jgi:hypothetical protein
MSNNKATILSRPLSLESRHPATAIARFRRRYSEPKETRMKRIKIIYFTKARRGC